MWIGLIVAVYFTYHITQSTGADSPPPPDSSVATTPEPSDETTETSPAVPSAKPTKVTTPAAPLKRAAAVKPPPAARPASGADPHFTASRTAVLRVQRARLQDDANTARQHLDRLKQALSAWQTRYIPLLANELGRRIATSPQLLELAEAQFQKVRPTADQVRGWERDLEQLTAIVRDSGAKPDALVSVSPEHVAVLKQLGDTLQRAATSVNDQSSLLDGVMATAAGTSAGTQTLEQAIKQRAEESKRADEQRAMAAARQARAKAAEEHAARMAQLAREKDEAEHRLKELREQANIDGLNEETKQREQAILEARLDREFQRVRGVLDTHLCAFTRPGFAHRQDGTKGPVSFSLIQTKGALQPTRTGMERLMALASVGNDRPRGPIPMFIGGDNGWRLTRTEPIEVAQQLLKKYGGLMVKKGMLAP
jgi:hypothetical protein